MPEKQVCYPPFRIKCNCDTYLHDSRVDPAVEAKVIVCMKMFSFAHES